jgi:Cytochrome c554 and c-prime
MLHRLKFCAGYSLLLCLYMGLHTVHCFCFQTGGVEVSALPDRKAAAGGASRAEYTGPEVCARCHVSQAKTQIASPMGRAALPASQVQILREHTLLKFQLGPYMYEITRQQDKSIYSVAYGSRTISEPILYAFGSGAAGQTYLFLHNGAYYESRVSFFVETAGLDITFGHSSSIPWSLEDALGHRLDTEKTRACFGCHNTASFASGDADPGKLIPGVTCEACHGPGAKHVAAMQGGEFRSTFIFNPARLGPDDLTNFCGACHRTFLDVVSLKIHGIRNVRFQPYRLMASRCWNPDDTRIRCVSCHDPHRARVRKSAFYDEKCIACHPLGNPRDPSRTQKGLACPVDSKHCIKCHMPKVGLPDAHAMFTDHQIRVTRPGEHYPD